MRLCDDQTFTSAGIAQQEWKGSLVGNLHGELLLRDARGPIARPSTSPAAAGSPTRLAIPTPQSAAEV